MGEERVTVASSGGFEVATWIATPAGEHRGAVVLCHGLTTGADDDGPFLPLRDLLVRRGLLVLRFDARCHGETGGSWRDLSLRGWRDDIEAVVDATRTRIGQLPLALLAASFSGGPAIGVAARRTDISALVLWNPVLDYGATYLDGSHPAGLQVLGTRGDADLPDWAELEVPWADVPFSSALLDEFRGDLTPATLAELAAPVRIFHGAGDQFVPIEISSRVAAAAPGASLRVYPLARHGFRGIQWLVRRESVRWIARHLH